MNCDRIGEVYAGLIYDPETQEAARERIDWICSQVQTDPVVDLGCSQGVASILLARAGHRVIGIDIEAPALGFALGKIQREDSVNRKRLQLIQGAGGRLPFASDSFSTVVLGEVLERLGDPTRVLSEVERVLRPLGRLILTTPFGFLSHPDHKRGYYPNQLLNVTSRAFRTLHLDIQGSRYLRYAGEIDPAAQPQAPDPIVIETENHFLAKELRYNRRITEPQSKLNDANLKYRHSSESALKRKTLLHGARPPAASRGGCGPAPISVAVLL